MSVIFENMDLTVAVTGLWPERENYTQDLLINPTVKSQGTQGRPLYRSGSQPTFRKWSFVLRHLTADQKEDLESFQELVGIGVEPFYYNDVRPASQSGGSGGSGGSYIVQFAQPMLFDLDDEGSSYSTEVFLNEYAG